MIQYMRRETLNSLISGVEGLLAVFIRKRMEQNYMKKVLMTMAALLVLPTQAALPESDTPRTPRELAQRVFHKAAEWKEMRLSPDTVLLRGTLADTASGKDMHVFLVVQTKSEKPRLMLTHSVAAVSDQYARFELKGAELRAYHANGTLLARLRMWEAPPAQYATAPELVSLRLVGEEPGIVIAEAENLTGFPVVLRRGKVFVIEREENEVRCRNLGLKIDECSLNPGQCKQVRLRIASKRPVHSKDLLKVERVELVYRAQDNLPCGAEISPAWVLPPGVPQLGDQGYAYPIRLRDDFAVVCESGMGGVTMHRLALYQLNNGVWFHAGYLKTQGNSTPCAFEIEQDKIRVRDYLGRWVGVIVYPGLDAMQPLPAVDEKG